MNSISNNKKLFDQLLKQQETSFIIHLNDSFADDLEKLRDKTSKPIHYKNQNYRSVYLDSKSYGVLTIDFLENQQLQLIVNLEFYYVYGIYVDETLFAFKGEAFEALKSMGFQPKEIPYGDGYYDIDKGLTTKQLEDLKLTTVNLIVLRSSLSMLIDPKIDWEDKREAILVTFWSLIEGIRFSYISNSIHGLITGIYSDQPFNNFYKLAEQWAKLSLAAAEKGILDPRIAVYELHRLKQ